MTLRAWLHQRTPPPPEQLSANVERALGDRCAAEASAAPGLCLDAADELLRDLLSRPSAGRESALDLLTVDALVTYAIEAASEQPETFVDRTRRAMHRLALAAG